MIVQLAVWLPLSAALPLTCALILWYIRWPDDPWWVPFAAPYLVTWCWAHNARRLAWAGTLEIAPAPPRGMSKQQGRSRGGWRGACGVEACGLYTQRVPATAIRIAGCQLSVQDGTMTFPTEGGSRTCLLNRC